MNSVVVLYTAAVLMAFVAAVCTALCCAWSVPSWRRRLAQRGVANEVMGTEIVGLAGWPARVGSALVSIGIAACAVIGWCGSYCVFSALIAVSR